MGVESLPSSGDLASDAVMEMLCLLRQRLQIKKLLSQGVTVITPENENPRLVCTKTLASFKAFHGFYMGF